MIAALVATVSLALVLDDASDGAADAVDCSKLLADSFVDAGPKARACGEDVEVVSERTPWETTWATPDGTTRLDISAVASRTQVSGEWTEIDTTVAGTPGEGVLEVAAPVYPMEFNAGGEAGKGAPLGSITSDGNRLDVWFPTDLPVPVVDGSQVSYRLAEGVRLVVSVSGDGTGFLPVVELRNPDAAERFRRLVDAARPDGFPGGSGDLVFSTALSDGLRLVPEEQGSVLVVDEAEEVAFVASPPAMWDSAGGMLELPESVTEVGAGDRVNAPAEGDTIRMMDTRVDGTRIVLTPDAGMLESSDTVWPVYLDPYFGGKGAAERIAIRTGGYTGSLYNWGDISSTSPGQGAGYCTAVASCNTVFTQRLIWEFTGLDSVRGMVGADIITAAFTVNGVHSYSCAATTTDMHVLLEGVSPGHTWGSYDWHQWTRYSSRTEAHSASCGNTGYRSFDATSAVKHFAEYDWATLPLGLKARDESTMTGWKRFRDDATLSVEWNRPPNAPSDLRLTSPINSACAVGSARPFINSETPTMSAIVTDPDVTNVNARFYVVATSDPSRVLWDGVATPSQQLSGARFSSTVGAGLLAHDKTYAWRARAGDGSLLSPYSAWCEFTVDLKAPPKPKVAAVTSGGSVAAVYESGQTRGGIGLTGTFRLTPDPNPDPELNEHASDVVAYDYSFVDATTMTTKSVTPGGALDVTFTPTNASKVTLYVKSVDRAENRSGLFEYSFTVASPVEDAIWKLDERTGTIAADAGPTSAGPLQIDGPEWVEGPHQLFGSRDDDWALGFDGIDDAAVGATVLDTRASFTVTAHVRLPEGSRGEGNFTALSQDGPTQSAFQLGYRSDCGGQECWSFSMPNTSSDAAATSATVFLSDIPQVDDQWVHLVGEHNATTDTVRMWACPVGTPNQPMSGAPVGGQPVSRLGDPWQGSGGFAVGRGQASAVGANWWPGAIDNVRVFSGEIVDESKLRRLCQGAEAENYGEGAAALTAIDPTVKED